MKTHTKIPEWFSRFAEGLSKKSPDTHKESLSLEQVSKLLQGPGARIARWQPEREKRGLNPGERGD